MMLLKYDNLIFNLEAVTSAQWDDDILMLSLGGDIISLCDEAAALTWKILSDRVSGHLPTTPEQPSITVGGISA